MGVKHFVFISSIFAHLDKSAPLYSIYGISKRHAEEIIEYCLNRDNIPYTILRPSQLYGNEAAFINHHPFLYHIIKTASQGQKISLFGEYGGLSNFLHVKDFAEIIYRVVTKKVYGLYDCVTETPNTYLEIAEAVFDLTENSINIEFESDREESGGSFPFDHTLYKKINFFPQIDIIKGLEEILQNDEVFV